MIWPLFVPFISTLYTEETCTGKGDVVTLTFPGVMQVLWDSDINRVSSALLTTKSAGKRYFSNIDEATLGKTFQLFVALLDNYERNIGNPEWTTAAEKAEEDVFLDAILDTEVMKVTESYLVSQGKIPCGKTFRSKLQELWFDTYPRSNGGVVDSSGFEHVFVGERRRNTVVGLHSWVQLAREERQGTLVVDQLATRSEPNILTFKYSWHGGTKFKGSSMFVGTSPQFDMAIYTICALEFQNKMCRFRLNGKPVNIQTYDIKHQAGDQIGTAYPAT